MYNFIEVCAKYKNNNNKAKLHRNQCISLITASLSRTPSHITNEQLLLEHIEAKYVIIFIATIYWRMKLQ